MRASSVPNLYAFCLNKRSCIFVQTGRPLLLILRFCVSFLVPPDSPKNGTVKMLFFCSFTKLCMRGTVFRLIFVKIFASGLKKRNVLVSTETLWLMATGKATREALLSEAGFEKVFRTQNWVRRSKLFCR